MRGHFVSEARGWSRRVDTGTRLCDTVRDRVSSVVFMVGHFKMQRRIFFSSELPLSIIRRLSVIFFNYCKYDVRSRALSRGNRPGNDARRALLIFCLFVMLHRSCKRSRRECIGVDVVLHCGNYASIKTDRPISARRSQERKVRRMIFRGRVYYIARAFVGNF